MDKLLTLLTVAQRLTARSERLDKSLIHWSWYVVVAVMIVCAALLTYQVALDQHMTHKMALVITGCGTCLLYAFGYLGYRYMQYLKFKKMKQVAFNAVDDTRQMITKFAESIDHETWVKWGLGAEVLYALTRLFKKSD